MIYHQDQENTTNPRSLTQTSPSIMQTSTSLPSLPRPAQKSTVKKRLSMQNMCLFANVRKHTLLVTAPQLQKKASRTRARSSRTHKRPFFNANSQRKHMPFANANTSCLSPHHNYKQCFRRRKHAPLRRIPALFSTRNRSTNMPNANTNTS
jgi:hypothetical protein